MKGFLLSRRPRDPALARAESAATAAIAIAGRFKRERDSEARDDNSATNLADDVGSRKSSAAIYGPASDDGRGDGVSQYNIKDYGDDQENHTTAIATAAGDMVISQSTQEAGATEGAVLPVAVAKPAVAGKANDNPEEHENPCTGTAIAASPAATAAAATPPATDISMALVPAEIDVGAMTVTPVVPALFRDAGPAAAALGETSSPKNDSCLRGLREQDRQPQSQLSAAGAVVPSDAFLSYRRKVLAVVFPRPHTHQARKRTGRGQRDIDFPGPGAYKATGGSDEWGVGPNAPLVAPKRCGSVLPILIRLRFL